MDRKSPTLKLHQDVNNSVRIFKDQDPLTWRLVEATNDGEEVDEKIFTVQGIIEDKLLPPIQNIKR